MGALIGVGAGDAGRAGHPAPADGRHGPPLRRASTRWASGSLAFGLADVTFGNGFIAAFTCGIALGVAEHDIADDFEVFSENLSSILSVLTFFVFGALIVATGYGGDVGLLLLFVAFALLVARPLAVAISMLRVRLPGPHRAFIAWFGPKGVASMLFALFVLKSAVGERDLIFEVAAFVILASIIAHGLTDTVGSNWIERRVSDGWGADGERREADRSQAVAGRARLGLESGRRRSWTHLVEAMWRLMPSSFGSKPSARPTSWGRCSTARPRSRLTTLAASGCCMSRLRWQSGHGVTRQSAPASSASPTWVPAWRSETSRAIVMIGKPQHLRAPSYSTTSPPSASISCSR